MYSIYAKLSEYTNILINYFVWHILAIKYFNHNSRAFEALRFWSCRINGKI